MLQLRATQRHSPSIDQRVADGQTDKKENGGRNRGGLYSRSIEMREHHAK